MSSHTRDQLMVGVSEVEITPPPGLPMDGYMARTESSAGVHDALLAQVLVLDDGRMRAAVVTLDVLAVSAAFADRLRESLANLLGASPDAILICASHTHAGPAGLQHWFPAGGTAGLNAWLMDTIEAHVIGAAQLARSHMIPARLTTAAGEIDGLCGDRNAAKPAPDPRLTVLCFDGPAGLPVAIIVHYACHPTVLGPQLDYSADLPGAMRAHIQTRYPGVTCLYLNGAAGNISTRFFRGEQSFAEVARLGNLLGDYALAMLERREHTPITTLSAACTHLELPLRTFTTVSLHQFEVSGSSRIDQTRAEGAAIEAQLARSFRGQIAQRATLCVLHIGPWVLLGVPGEPFNEMAAAIRQESPTALIVGYTNDYLGYFPTQQAIDAQTYEALSSPYDVRAHDLIQRALIGLISSYARQ